MQLGFLLYGFTLFNFTQLLLTIIQLKTQLQEYLHYMMQLGFSLLGLSFHVSSIMECPSIILTAYTIRTAEINFWDTRSNQGRHLGQKDFEVTSASIDLRCSRLVASYDRQGKQWAYSSPSPQGEESVENRRVKLGGGGNFGKNTKTLEIPYQNKSTHKILFESEKGNVFKSERRGSESDINKLIIVNR